MSPASAQGLGPPAATAGDPSACRNNPDPAARLRCYEASTSTPATGPLPTTLGPDAGTWRLVRTPDPAGGKDAISITQTADIARSDVDLAGLMIRCGDSGLEAVIIMVTPLPPRSRPAVNVRAETSARDFGGTVLGPGLAILLPPQANALITGPWLAAREVDLLVKGDGSEAHGVVPLTGLAAALPILTANCASR